MNENEKNYDDMTDEEIDEGIEGLLELLREKIPKNIVTGVYFDKLHHAMQSATEIIKLMKKEYPDAEVKFDYDPLFGVDLGLTIIAGGMAVYPMSEFCRAAQSADEMCVSARVDGKVEVSFSYKDVRFIVDPEAVKREEERCQKMIAEAEQEFGDYMNGDDAWQELVDEYSDFIIDPKRFFKAMSMVEDISCAALASSGDAECSISDEGILGDNMFLTVTASCIGIGNKFVEEIREADDDILGEINISVTPEGKIKLVVAFNDVRINHMDDNIF